MHSDLLCTSLLHLLIGMCFVERPRRLKDQSVEMRDLIQRTSKSQAVPVKLASGKDKEQLFLLRLGRFFCLFGSLDKIPVCPKKKKKKIERGRPHQRMQEQGCFDQKKLTVLYPAVNLDNPDLSGKDPFCTVLPETRLGAVVHDFGTGIHRGKVYCVFALSLSHPKDKSFLGAT